LIEVKNLYKKYGNNEAVKGLNFKIEKGRIYGFLGPNGAGKSTTMNIITGCLAATSGQVLINGHDIFEEPQEAKACIGYLPEQPPLYTDFTPLEYLTFVAEAKGLEADDLRDQVAYVIKQTQIEDVQNRLIRNLSKGYKQRVGIAQAMLGSPEIIILDEPTVGLDPKQIIEIRSLIKSLAEEHTVILSSHILSEISEICDYIIIIAHGTMVASDTLHNLQKIFAESSVVKLTAKGSFDRIRMILNELDGISEYKISESAEQNPELFDAEIEVKPGYDIRENIFKAFSEDNIPLLRLATDALSLEDMFLKLTSDETGTEGANAIRLAISKSRSNVKDTAETADSAEESAAEAIQTAEDASETAAPAETVLDNNEEKSEKPVDPTLEAVDNAIDIITKAKKEKPAPAAKPSEKKKSKNNDDDDDYKPLFS